MQPADGTGATAPTVTIDPLTGNWVINGVNTGFPARGPQGPDGANGSTGANGANGADGKSAYQLWKEEIALGTTVDPHSETGDFWPPTKNTPADFWEFLRGKDGKDGADGAAGHPGTPATP